MENGITGTILNHHKSRIDCKVDMINGDLLNHFTEDLYRIEILYKGHIVQKKTTWIYLIQYTQHVYGITFIRYAQSQTTGIRIPIKQFF